MQSLVEQSRSFVPAVTECAIITAEWFEQIISPRPAGSANEPRIELMLDSLYLVLHLTDRLSFARFGAAGRQPYMDSLLAALVEEIESKELRESLRDDYNARQTTFATFSKLDPAQNESLAGTLFWEVGKDIGGRYAASNPATVTLLTLAATDAGGLVEEAFNRFNPVDRA